MDAVFVIAETPDGRIALVRQHRYPIGSWQTEIIAGGLPSGVDPESQARQEVYEEAHLVASEASLIGRFAMQPSRSVNFGYVVHALIDSTEAADVTQQEAEESIECVDFYPKTEVMAMVAAGEINGAYCLASLAIYWQSVGRV